MKCISCGIKIKKIPKNVSYDELLCDSCYARWLKHQEGVDICSICGEGFPYRTLDDISEDSFDLICERCKGEKNV